MNSRSTNLEETIKLPPPHTTGGMSLHQVLRRRRSCRDFSGRPLTREQLAQLCWAAQGITHPEGLRTAPSAGAICPVRLLIATADGLFAYLPTTHALRRRLRDDVRRELQRGALDQDCVGEAPACLIVAVSIRQMARKYGDRAAQYCMLEAGHLAQNALLEATAMGVGSVPVGAFQDEEISAILMLPEELLPVYLLPVGYPQ